MTNLQDDRARQVLGHLPENELIAMLGPVAANRIIAAMDEAAQKRAQADREHDAKHPPDYSAVAPRPDWPVESDRNRDRIRAEMQSLGLGRKYRNIPKPPRGH